jgi:hypothetical protein
MASREAGLYGEEARLWESADAAGFGRILGIPGRLWHGAGGTARSAGSAGAATAGGEP